MLPAISTARTASCRRSLHTTPGHSVACTPHSAAPRGRQRSSAQPAYYSTRGAKAERSTAARLRGWPPAVLRPGRTYQRPTTPQRRQISPPRSAPPAVLPPPHKPTFKTLFRARPVGGPRGGARLRHSHNTPICIGEILSAFVIESVALNPKYDASTDTLILILYLYASTDTLILIDRLRIAN